MNRTGVMTVARDEEATIAFVIGAALPHVDHYTYIDTGSKDNSLKIVNTLFDKEIKDGKLSVVDFPIGIEIYRAREIALANLRDAGIDFFFVLDGDDVCFDKTIAQAVAGPCQSPIDQVNNIWVPSFELYQYKAETSKEWLAGIQKKDLKFYEMTKHQGQFYVYARPTRIQNVHDAYAKGNWTDESNGLTPEGVFHKVARAEARWDVKLSAHYGWARPMAEKRAKAAIRYGDRSRWTERIEKLHEHPHHILRGLIPFANHPEIFSRLGKQVMELL